MRQVFVTYLKGALYVHPLWFYKHQHDNRVCSKLFVACQQWWFLWRSIVLMFAESQRVHIYRAPVRYVTKTWSVVLLIKKYIYSYLKCIVYEKLLKPRQSFRLTLYFWLCKHLPSICPDQRWGPPSLLYDGYQVFTGGKERPGVTQTPHPLLVLWSRKSRAIPLLTLWAVQTVQSLSAWTMVHFTFFPSLAWIFDIWL